MRPKLFPSLGLRDPGFLGGAPPCPITTADLNTHAWYRADSHISGDIVGDRMDTTVDKTSAAAPNFNLFASGVSNMRLRSNIVDNDANLIVTSADWALGDWIASNFTKDSSTTGTFTAQNGYIRQACYFTDPGLTYTYKFRARAVTGNTNLRVLHDGSATGASTAVTLTGVLTEYSVTFLGHPTGGIVYIGLQDQNAAGFGQVEQTYAAVYRSDHDGNYVATTNIPYWGKRNGVPTFGCHGIGVATTGYWVNSANRAQALPFTIYMTYWPRLWLAGGYHMTCNDPTLLSVIMSNSGTPNYQMSMYLGTAPFAWQTGLTPVPPNQWSVLTYVFNGASSEMRVNLNVADPGNNPVWVYSPNKWQIGGDSLIGSWQNGEFHEVITRYTVDNTATQDAFIRYMGYRVGLIL